MEEIFYIQKTPCLFSSQKISTNSLLLIKVYIHLLFWHSRVFSIKLLPNLCEQTVTRQRSQPWFTLVHLRWYLLPDTLFQLILCLLKYNSSLKVHHLHFLFHRGSCDYYSKHLKKMSCVLVSPGSASLEQFYHLLILFICVIGIVLLLLFRGKIVLTESNMVLSMSFIPLNTTEKLKTQQQ